jgi:hypothetical protein
MANIQSREQQNNNIIILALLRVEEKLFLAKKNGSCFQVPSLSDTMTNSLCDRIFTDSQPHI